MREENELDKMYEAQMELLTQLQEYKDMPSYSVINQHMSTICKELNNMRISAITGKDLQNKE